MEPHDPPDAMEYREISRIRNAAYRAVKLYPGIVGEVLASDLNDYADFGYRHANNSPMPRLADAILKTTTHSCDG